MEGTVKEERHSLGGFWIQFRGFCLGCMCSSANIDIQPGFPYWARKSHILPECSVRESFTLSTHLTGDGWLSSQVSLCSLPDLLLGQHL
jgi:hypothetical protein